MSTTRHRSTWGDRAASGHPATPVDNEGPAIPGTPEDPAMDAYAKGDPSAWAEDPMPGPYPESGHPATPDEGSAWDKAAAMEAKAAKCIVIAMHMLGDPKGDRAKIAAVEAQAMSLLSLPSTHIASTLKRIGAEVEEEVEEEETEEAKKKAAVSVKAEDEVEDDEVAEAKKKAAAKRRAAEEAEAEVEAACKKAAAKKAGECAEPDGDEEAKKKAASDLTARVARIERILIRLAAEEEEAEPAAEETEEAKKKAAKAKLAADCAQAEKNLEEAKKKAAAIRALLAADEPAEETEEAKKKAAFGVEDQTLEAMLAEEGMGAEDQTLEAMLAEEGMDEVAPAITEELMYDDPSVDEFGFGTDLEDPMGLMETSMSEEESLLLASLHVQAGDESIEEVEDEEAKKKAARATAAAKNAAENRQNRTASAPRPQPKTASNGATKLGGPVQRVASSSGNELEALWPTAPDVSKHF